VPAWVDNNVGGEVVIFTDGSMNNIKETEEKIFGQASGEEDESIGASGAVVYFRSQLSTSLGHPYQPTKLIYTPGICSQEIAFLTPYLTEAIAIISALSNLRLEQNFHLHKYDIFSDCESLVKAIYSTQELHNSILNRDPYMAAIHNLSRGLHIRFRWVRSHVERRNKIPSTWSFLDVGNYLADRLADMDTKSLAVILPASLLSNICVFRMPQVLKELRASSQFVLVHNNTPISEQQIKKLHQRLHTQRYLIHRQGVSTRKTKWSQLSLRFAKTVFSKMPEQISATRAHKIIFDKFDNDQYKDDSDHQCYLCGYEGADTLQHLSLCQRPELAPGRENAEREMAAVRIREDLEPYRREMMVVKGVVTQLLAADYKCWFGLYNQTHRTAILQAMGPGPSKKPTAVRQQIISWLTPWAHYLTLILDARNTVKAAVHDQQEQVQSYGYYTPLSDPDDPADDETPLHGLQSPVFGDLNQRESNDTDIRSHSPAQKVRSRRWANKSVAHHKPVQIKSSASAAMEQYCVTEECYIQAYAQGISTLKLIRPEQDVRDVLTYGLGPIYGRNSRLYLVDEGNLTCQVVPSSSLATYSGIKASKLHNGNVLLVRSLNSTIKPIQTISCLNRQGDNSGALWRDLMDRYRGIRNVRGNGECWYRCLGVYVIECAINDRPNWTRLTSHLRCHRSLLYLEPSDLINFEHGLTWLTQIESDATYRICQLEEDMCNGASYGTSLDIDKFLTQAITLNCIEAIQDADSDLQTTISSEYGVDHIDGNLDMLWTHILYGTDSETGNRTWATEHVDKLQMYSRFGLSAQVEMAGSHSTHCIDVQTPLADTVAHMVLLLRNGHYDILYENNSRSDYKQVWKISNTMDGLRTRLLGPYPDRKHRHKYLNSVIIDGVLSQEQSRSQSGVQIYDSSLWEAIRTDNNHSCERILRGRQIDADTHKLLIPINIDNQHFVLAVVDIRDVTVWLYDPLGEENINLERADKISAAIGHFLRCNFCSKIWIGPLQRNSYDCGVFVIAIATAIARGTSITDLTHVDCQQVRSETWEILLQVWWQEQRLNGNLEVHRQRGVEEIHIKEKVGLIEVTNECARVEKQKGASQSSGVKSRLQFKSGLTSSKITEDKDKAAAGRRSKSNMTIPQFFKPTSSRPEIQHSGPNGDEASEGLGVLRSELGGAPSREEGQVKPDKTISIDEAYPIKDVMRQLKPLQDDEVAHEASEKNATTWWRRGFRTQIISKPEPHQDSSKAEVLLSQNNNYHDSGD
jgi:hypothetical protein